jgi:hypothetical protein
MAGRQGEKLRSTASPKKMKVRIPPPGSKWDAVLQKMKYVFTKDGIVLHNGQLFRATLQEFTYTLYLNGYTL